MKCEPIHFLCNIEFFFVCSKEKNTPNRKHETKEEKKINKRRNFLGKKKIFI